MISRMSSELKYQEIAENSQKNNRNMEISLIYVSVSSDLNTCNSDNGIYRLLNILC